MPAIRITNASLVHEENVYKTDGSASTVSAAHLVDCDSGNIFLENFSAKNNSPIPIMMESNLCASTCIAKGAFWLIR